jgi:hypothetical protein
MIIPESFVRDGFTQRAQKGKNAEEREEKGPRDCTEKASKFGEKLSKDERSLSEAETTRKGSQW